jgi:uncharacterized repeat protein (TIGR04076 family)
VGNYLSDFTENPVYNKIKDLIPSGICPFLFYNLTPYIFTITSGGWFDWTKKLKDFTYRKEVVVHDFTRKKVNSLYVNEVLVRCPNPHIIVVVGVGLWTDKKIKLRILHSSSICINDHKSGDEVLLDIEEFKSKVTKYNASFPEILMQSLTGGLPDETFENCEVSAGVTVQVSKIVFPCRYHKRERNFLAGYFIPDGFCPHIFRVIYPNIMAVMYNAQDRAKLNVRHPGSGGYIVLSIEKINKIRNSVVRSIVNLLKWGFETLYYPIDLLDYEIEITILENESTGCSLKKGKKYFVNMKDENFLCPSSFHSLYPYLMLAASGHQVRWRDYQGIALQPCPDCVGTIYSIN